MKDTQKTLLIKSRMIDCSRFNALHSLTRSFKTSDLTLRHCYAGMHQLKIDRIDFCEKDICFKLGR